jgi:uncharacterized protein
MKLKLATKVEVKESPGRGLGVFATEYIIEGEVIEECHMITLPIPNGEPSALLMDYRFNWPQEGEKKEQVVVLGNGSIYNHNDNNNAVWRDHPRWRLFQFVAIKRILPGEEIFIYYGNNNYWGERMHIKKI